MYSTRLKRAYPSDLTDAPWEILQPLIPPLSPDAAYHLHERRELVNAILYVLRSGWMFRSLPHDLPVVLQKISRTRWACRSSCGCA